MKHYSRFHVFLGAPVRQQFEPLWQRVLMHALRYMPSKEQVLAVFDLTVSKESGCKIEGLASTATERVRRAGGTARCAVCSL